MTTLNFQNIEELLFHDRKAQSYLPEDYFSLFEQWRLAQRMPMLRQLGKRAVLDVLNALTEDDIAALELYFQDKIIVEKLNYSITKNLKIPLEKSEICKELCAVADFNYFSTWRDQNYLYVSFWR